MHTSRSPLLAILIIAGILFGCIVSAAPVPPGANTLVHWNGTNNQTTAQELMSGKVAYANGAAYISTSSKKFGSASFFSDASSAKSYGVINNPNSDIDFGSGDFTVEFWAYPASYGGADQYTVVLGDYGTGIIIGSGMFSNGKLSVLGRSASSTQWSINSANSTSTGWHHYALSRKGSTIRYFYDGVCIGTASYAGAMPSLSNVPIYLMGRAEVVTNGGFVDEVVVVKGNATYTSDFTPETTEYTYPPTSPSAPTSSFTASPTSGISNISVTFTDTSTGSPTTWNYSYQGISIGNNTKTIFSTVQNPVATFMPGNYSISLNTTNAYGFNESTQSTWINVTPGPTAAFSANVTMGTAPLAVLFTDASTYTSNWYWEFGDGNTSTSQSPSFVYETAGVYSVNLRAGNGGYYDWENKTAYITVSSSIYSIAPNFTAVPPSGTIPLSVSFTDTTSSFNATPLLYAWDFGDGNTSTLQNPSNVYYTAGLYNVTQSVSNVTSGLNVTAYHSVNATVPSGFNQQDVTMTPTYIVRLRFTDSTTNAPVVGAVVVLGSVSNTTDSSGYATFSSTYSLVSFSASASGYYGTTGSFVVDGDVDRTYQMVPLTETVQNTNTVYTQHFISFRVVDMYRRPLSPVMVTAYYVNSSLPVGSDVDYLTRAFGIDATVASSMLNSSVALQGMTGTDGKIGFVMFPAIQYTIQAVNTTMGAACQITAYPTDSDYLLYCPLQSQSVVPNNTATQIAGSYVWITEPNNSYVTFNAQYQDPLGITTDLWFNVTCPDNQTQMFQDHPGNPGTSVYRQNFTLPNVRGDQFNAYLKYNRSA